MKHKLTVELSVCVALALNTILPVGHASAQFLQQGGKLVGTGAVGSLVYQGMSVCISSDGNTAIVGGTRDNGSIGAVWVFTQSGSVWTQQGNKLVGTGVAGSLIYQGASVGVSSDGNTAVLGAYGDNGEIGAVWVFTRSGSVWSQQGSKLVGTGGVSFTRQGSSIAISSDGNTVIVGGPYDNSYKGAAWVFTRSGSVWTQQGNKLVGSGASATSFQGASVSLSSDGNTAIVGGSGDAGALGAAWIFTRSGGVWTQQGAKLVGTGAVGAANQGSSVAISADGNTALVGGMGDNGFAGAAWVFTRSGGVWSQQGNKLVGTGAVGIAEQGWSVAISGNGNTAIIGGDRDNGYAGAAWVFTRNGGVWSQQGNKLVGIGAVGGSTQQGKSVSISSNGTTLIVGGPIDNGGAGAAWIYFNSATSVGEADGIPSKFQLDQNYPNPFNPETRIGFSVQEKGFVSLKAFDILGREVATLINEEKPAGKYEIPFDAKDLSSGVYFYRLQAGGFVETRKLVVQK